MFYNLLNLMMEPAIISENSLLEIAEAIALFICLLPCAYHLMNSRLRIGKYFWLAAILIFFSAIRRELSFVPELLLPDNFILLGQSYEWWEDTILTIIALIALSSLVYAWRYLWGILKGVPVWLYTVTVVLVIVQYLGENSIGFEHDMGVVVEESAEAIIYFIALVYLWRFKLKEFEQQLILNL